MVSVAIDTGVRGCGAALFEDQDLVAAGYAEIGDCSAVGGAELVAHWVDLRAGTRPRARAVVEQPQAYQLRSQRGDQNDLIRLALVAGAVGHALWAIGFDVEFVLPRDWKGQITKAVSLRRLIKCLSPAEYEDLIQWPTMSLRHNVVDAIHLGLRKFTRRNA